jgi:hypothetical protein
MNSLQIDINYSHLAINEASEVAINNGSYNGPSRFFIRQLCG